MTVEYIFLGGVLIVMGAVQAWLRHGPGAKAVDEADRSGPPPKAQGTERQRSPGGVRSGRAWEAWTAILGGVGIALGIVLVILGVMGR